MITPIKIKTCKVIDEIDFMISQVSNPDEKVNVFIGKKKYKTLCDFMGFKVKEYKGHKIKVI